MFRRPLLRPIVWALLFLVLLSGGSFFLLERKLFPTVLAFAEAKAVQTAVETVNSAVRADLLSHRVRYEDLVTVHKDRQGRVVLMQADAVRVNELAAGMAVTVEKALGSLEKEGFGIPLGQVLGSQFLANYGPRIKVQIIPVGSVKVQMQDRFESSGINQTRHRFYMRLDTSVRIVVPLHHKEVRVATEVPLVENIIVGAVPETFVSIPGVIELSPSK